MKIKTNVRAGKQTRGGEPSSSSSSSISNVVISYVPPVSRCVGV